MAKRSILLLGAAVLGLAHGGSGAIWQSSTPFSETRQSYAGASSRMQCSNGVCRKVPLNWDRKDIGSERSPRRPWWGAVNTTATAVNYAAAGSREVNGLPSSRQPAWQNSLSTRWGQVSADAQGQARRLGGNVEAFIVNGLKMPGIPRLHCNKTLTFWGNMLAGAISRR